MPELITWAGRTLSGSDGFGKWVTTSLDGWWDSPDTKGESEDRAQADGEFDLPIYNQARLITATGNLHAGTHAQLHEAMDFLCGPMLGRFQVAGHGTARWVDAKRNSGVKFTPVTDTFAQWQVRLKAADPRKFGELRRFTVATGAPVSAFHRGNYAATPKFTVSGAMAGGYTLTVDGWDYTVTVPLVSGTPHVIDYNDGRLRVNGVIVQNSLGNTNTATVPPGEAVGVGLYAVTTGTGSAVMDLYDTFI